MKKKFFKLFVKIYLGVRNMKKYEIAIVGVTGAVGLQVFKWLIDLKFPFSNIYGYASKKSVGRNIHYKKYSLTVKELKENSFKGIDICFFCSNEMVSKKYVPYALKEKCLVIDNSSYFRMFDDVPIIIPSVNKEQYHKDLHLIANPNCATSILCSVLKPLSDLYPIDKVIVSTYQSISGLGLKAIEELKYQSIATLEGKHELANKNHFESLNDKLKYKIAFNCLPIVGTMLENNWTSEEIKIIKETKKILNQDFKIIANCIRVPTFCCHGETVVVEFKENIDVDNIIKYLKKQKELKLNNKILPVNSNCFNRLEVFVSRIRKVDDKTLTFYLLSDNLLKGAATNAIDIAFLAIGA